MTIQQSLEPLLDYLRGTDTKDQPLPITATAIAATVGAIRIAHICSTTERPVRRKLAWKGSNDIVRRRITAQEARWATALAIARSIAVGSNRGSAKVLGRPMSDHPRIVWHEIQRMISLSALTTYAPDYQEAGANAYNMITSPSTDTVSAYSLAELALCTTNNHPLTYEQISKYAHTTVQDLLKSTPALEFAPTL